MTKFQSLLLITATFSAPALASTPLSFEQGGVHYTGEVDAKSGVRRIVGREVGTGRNFDLRVRRDRVSGTYDGRDVDFRIAPTQQTTRS